MIIQSSRLKAKKSNSQHSKAKSSLSSTPLRAAASLRSMNSLKTCTKNICNQFGNQAPGSDEEIHQFCALHYNTTYEQFKKSDVNGPNELPLYTFLKSKKGFEGFDKNHKLTSVLEDMFTKADPDYASKPDIKWNFTKFIIDRNGNVVKRFEPTSDMAEVEKCAASLL